MWNEQTKDAWVNLFAHIVQVMTYAYQCRSGYSSPARGTSSTPATTSNLLQATADDISAFDESNV